MSTLRTRAHELCSAVTVLPAYMNTWTLQKITVCSRRHTDHSDRWQLGHFLHRHNSKDKTTAHLFQAVWCFPDVPLTFNIFQQIQMGKLLEFSDAGSKHTRYEGCIKTSCIEHQLRVNVLSAKSQGHTNTDSQPEPRKNIYFWATELSHSYMLWKHLI